MIIFSRRKKEISNLWTAMKIKKFPIPQCNAQGSVATLILYDTIGISVLIVEIV